MYFGEGAHGIPWGGPMGSHGGVHGIPWGGPWDPRVGPLEPWALGTHWPLGTRALGDPLAPPEALEGPMGTHGLPRRPWGALGDPWAPGGPGEPLGDSWAPPGDPWGALGPPESKV